MVLLKPFLQEIFVVLMNFLFLRIWKDYDYWCARPLWEVVSHKSPPSLSRDVKKLLLGRSQKDKNNVWNMNKDKTNVKDRLGDKKIPHKDCLV